MAMARSTNDRDLFVQSGSAPVAHASGRRRTAQAWRLPIPQFTSAARLTLRAML